MGYMRECPTLKRYPFKNYHGSLYDIGASIGEYYTDKGGY